MNDDAPYRPDGDTLGKATVAFVLGMAGIFVLPVICSIPAIIYGNQAKAQLRTNPRLGGRGLAQAGVILGWVGVAIGVLALLLFVLVVWAGVSLL